MKNFTLISKEHSEFVKGPKNNVKFISFQLNSTEWESWFWLRRAATSVQYWKVYDCTNQLN